MYSQSTWRQKIAKLALLGVVVQAAFVAFPAQSARAGGPTTLAISEINWAGSDASVTGKNDQWIELVNHGISTVDFALTPFEIEVDSEGTDCTPDSTGLTECESLVTLDSAFFGASDSTLAAGEHLVLGRLDATSTNVDLPVNPAAGLTRYIQLPAAAELPVTMARYYLLDVQAAPAVVIDSVGAQAVSPVPFAGQVASDTIYASSMQREFDVMGMPLDGTVQTSWTTAITSGVNLKNQGEAYATPGANNVKLMSATSVVFTPTNSTVVDVQPIVSGTVAADSTAVSALIATRNQLTNTDLPVQTVPVASASFSYAFTSLAAGRYVVDVTLVDADGNLSVSKNYTGGAMGNEANYVVVATSATALAAPTIGALPTVTSQPVVTLQGTVAATISSVDILRGGEFVENVTVTGGKFYATVSLVPNSLNTFMVIGATDMGEVSLPAVVSITHDNIAPLAVDVTKVSVSSNAPGFADSLVGNAKAAEAGAMLSVYSDSSATKLIAGPQMVAADGSFSRVSLGDNQYSVVYLRLVDAAGNVGQVSMVKNTITFTGVVTGITNDVVTTSQIPVMWNGVAGAVNYLVKFRTIDSAFGLSSVVCTTASTSCEPKVTLTDLLPGTQYIVAVAAVDVFGNVGEYAEYGVSTATQPVVVPAVVRTLPSPTPVVTATPSPSATPETGDVQSATDEAKNWTAWIVLALLAAVAVIAAVGYFYWFGGEAGEAALAAAGITEQSSKVSGSAKKDSKVEKSTEVPPTRRW